MIFIKKLNLNMGTKLKDKNQKLRSFKEVYLTDNEKICHKITGWRDLGLAFEFLIYTLCWKMFKHFLKFKSNGKLQT